MADEEQLRLQQFLAAQTTDASILDDAAPNVEEPATQPSEPTHVVPTVDNALMTPEQRLLEAELACNALKHKAWLALIHSVKTVSGANKTIEQPRDFRNTYLRSIYQRMLLGPYRYNASLWVDYLLFEAALLGLQLPAATLLPHSAAAGTTPPSAAAFECLEWAFGRALEDVYSPSVWIVYLNYLKKRDVPRERERMVAAYERALAKIGLDIYGGIVWADYISYVKAEKTESLFEEQVKMDALRKIYQRAVVVPHANLELIWKDYDAFENELNKMTAKKILGDKSPLYMNARVAFKELKNKMDLVQRTGLLCPWDEPRKTREQEDIWARLFEWERSNGALKLDDTQSHVLFERRVYMFRAALNPLSFSVRIWLAFVAFLDTKNKKDAQRILADACAIMPTQLILHFELAALLETSGAIEQAKTLYEDLLARQLAAIEAYTLLINKKKELAAVLEDGKDAGSIGATAESTGQLEEAREAMQRDNNRVFVQVMRFIRRTEDVAGARLYFSRARKLEHCAPSVFLASAQIEYFLAKEPVVAFKILELGMKRFVTLSGDAATNFKWSDETFRFVLEYCRLLLIEMDDANAKAVYERICPLSTPSESVDVKVKYLLPILDLIIEHENAFGGGTALTSLIEKRHALLGITDPFLAITEKYEPPVPAVPVTVIQRPSTSVTSRSSHHHHHHLPQQQQEVSTSSSVKRKSSKFELSDLEPVPIPRRVVSTKLPTAIQDLLDLLPSHDKYVGPSIDSEELMNLCMKVVVPSVADHPLVMKKLKLDNN